MSEETKQNAPEVADYRDGLPAPKPLDQLRPHTYDGIQEYDNPAPMWIQGLFLVTVLFSLGYIPYYLLGYALDFDTPQVQLAKEMKQIEEQRQIELAKNPQKAAGPSEEALAALVVKSEVVSSGQATFATNCASCHGPQGQGLVGPNLTDNAWIHGGKLTEIRKTIVDGVPAKGMIAWGAMLKPDAVDGLVAYIRSIQGTNPPNAKPPQGEVVTAMSTSN